MHTICEIRLINSYNGLSNKTSYLEVYKNNLIFLHKKVYIGVIVAKYRLAPRCPIKKYDQLRYMIQKKKKK